MSLKIEYNIKEAQSSAFGRPMGNPSVGDLLRGIAEDNSATMGQRAALTAQLSAAKGSMPRSTLLGQVGSVVFGATVANIGSKFLNMGPVGRGLATAVGAGVGNVLYNEVRDNGIPGWSSY